MDTNNEVIENSLVEKTEVNDSSLTENQLTGSDKQNITDEIPSSEQQNKKNDLNVENDLNDNLNKTGYDDENNMKNDISKDEDNETSISCDQVTSTSDSDKKESEKTTEYGEISIEISEKGSTEENIQKLEDKIDNCHIENVSVSENKATLFEESKELKADKNIELHDLNEKEMFHDEYIDDDECLQGEHKESISIIERNNDGEDEEDDDEYTDAEDNENSVLDENDVDERNRGIHKNLSEDESNKDDEEKEIENLEEVGQRGHGDGGEDTKVEDKKDPAYVPRKGVFYEHDNRDCEEEEEESEENLKRKEEKPKNKKWLHDKFRENEQAPKSNTELTHVYGYNIRVESSNDDGDAKPNEVDDGINKFNKKGTQRERQQNRRRKPPNKFFHKNENYPKAHSYGGKSHYKNRDGSKKVVGTEVISTPAHIPVSPSRSDPVSPIVAVITTAKSSPKSFHPLTTSSSIPSASQYDKITHDDYRNEGRGGYRGGRNYRGGRGARVYSNSNYNNNHSNQSRNYKTNTTRNNYHDENVDTGMKPQRYQQQRQKLHNKPAQDYHDNLTIKSEPSDYYSQYPSYVYHYPPKLYPYKQNKSKGWAGSEFTPGWKSDGPINPEAPPFHPSSTPSNLSYHPSTTTSLHASTTTSQLPTTITYAYLNPSQIQYTPYITPPHHYNPYFQQK